MSEATTPLKRTNLFDWHVAHGGRMVPFAGWEMPVQYPTGPKEEHHTTRNAAGLFDIDHMGQFSVGGPDAEAYFNHLTTWDVRQMKDNDAHYALMCYEDGGIVDDIYVYRLPGRWFVAVNADNRAKDQAWMQAQAAGHNVTVTDVSDETYMLALQGPKAIHILQKLTHVDMSSVPRFTIAEGKVNGIHSLISRTGYTGEDGVELFFPAEEALTMWEAILEVGQRQGIKPIGLAARDSLRFEPAFPLYGHEIAADITPIEARLGWAVKFNTCFIGRDALLKQKLEGPARLLVGFQMLDRSMPRQGYPVLHQNQVVGEVVAGVYAPTVDKSAGHAFVPTAIATPGTPIQIQIRNKLKEAVIIRRPLYRPAYK
ncbi:MAG: glycine cleavage system aminomethyltransferase GcvT [Anaerolineae bacterium]